MSEFSAAPDVAYRELSESTLTICELDTTSSQTTVELMIPSEAVGRMIGTREVNIKMLQQIKIS